MKDTLDFMNKAIGLLYRWPLWKAVIEVNCNDELTQRFSITFRAPDESTARRIAEESAVETNRETAAQGRYLPTKGTVVSIEPTDVEIEGMQLVEE